MSNYHKHAVEEMKRIGFRFDENDMPIEDPNEEFDMNAEMAMCVLEILDVFAKQGHSGMSASYCLSILEKTMKFEPITPLTGDDDEWTLIDDSMTATDTEVYQNKRCSHVFKENGRAYDIQGKVFWEWFIDDLGDRHKTCYTSSESHVPVTFPYTPSSVEEYRDSGVNDE